MKKQVDGQPTAKAEEQEQSGSEKLDAVLGEAFEKPEPKDEPTPDKVETTDSDETVNPESEEVEKPEPDDEEADLEKVSPKVQEAINKRINKIVAKQKAAEERAEKAEAEAQELRSKVEAKPSAEFLPRDVDPEYFTAPEAEVIGRARELREMRNWLVKNWDGFENEGKSYTSEQVRQRYSEVEDELFRVGGKAEALLEERRRQQREDQKRGRESRIKPVEKPRAAPSQPPRIPAPSASSAGKLPISATKAKVGFDRDKLMKEGVTPESLEREFEKAFG